MMNGGRGRKRNVYDRNRPSQLTPRSGQTQYIGPIASDVQ